jgi:hypothetical protein
MDTKRSLYEIEVALVKSSHFNFLEKIVVFNAICQGGALPIWHECDVLVCTNSGYLTEIEIKRSFSDFLADFKKKHDHQSDYIKNFYYCVPSSIKDKVLNFLDSFENKEDWRVKAGVVVFYEDNDWIDVAKCPVENKRCIKLTIEQRLYLARLGCIRVVSLKRKIIKMEKEIIENKNKEMDKKKELEESYGALALDIVSKTLGIEIEPLDAEKMGDKIKETIGRCTGGKYTTNGENGIKKEVILKEK